MTTREVKIFQKTEIGQHVLHGKKVFTVKETQDDFSCDKCGFKVLSVKCPHFFNKLHPDRVRPVCFSTERPDSKSVYFEERKNLWEHKKSQPTL